MQQNPLVEQAVTRLIVEQTDITLYTTNTATFYSTRGNTAANVTTTAT